MHICIFVLAHNPDRALALVRTATGSDYTVIGGRYAGLLALKPGYKAADNHPETVTATRAALADLGGDGSDGGRIGVGQPDAWNFGLFADGVASFAPVGVVDWGRVCAMPSRDDSIRSAGLRPMFETLVNAMRNARHDQPSPAERSRNTVTNAMYDQFPWLLYPDPTTHPAIRCLQTAAYYTHRTHPYLCSGVIVDDNPPRYYFANPTNPEGLRRNYVQREMERAAELRPDYVVYVVDARVGSPKIEQKSKTKGENL